MSHRVKAKMLDSVMVSKLVTGEEIVFVMMQNVPQQGISAGYPYLLSIKQWKIPDSNEIVEVPILEQYSSWTRKRNAFFISWSDIVFFKEVKPYFAELYLEHLGRTESVEYAKLLVDCEEQIRKSDQVKSKKAAADYKTRH